MNDLTKAFEMKEVGLYEKYHIERTDGRPLDKMSEFFVLRLDENCEPHHRAACLKAIRVYAQEIESELPLLSRDLLERYKTKSKTNKLNKKQ